MGGVIRISYSAFLTCNTASNRRTVVTRVTTIGIDAGQARRLAAIVTHMTISHDTSRAEVPIDIVTRTDGRYRSFFDQYLYRMEYRIFPRRLALGVQLW